MSDKFDAFVTYFERKWLDAVRANHNLSFNALARHGGGVPGPVYYWYVIIVNFFQFLNQNYDFNLCSTTSTR